jgi:hypothetical protein
VTPRLWLVVGAITVALVTAGVTYKLGSHGASEASRALYAIGSTHDLCLPSNTGKTFTIGMDVFANRGPGPVHIDRVEWLDNQGLKLLAIAAIQRQDSDQFAGFGEWRGYPPRNLAEGPTGPSYVDAWERRVPTEGANLPVTDDPDEHYYNILVSYSGTKGNAGPVRLSYTDAEGHKGTMDTLVKVKVRPRCAG